jgi:arylsulfate sulfotransferase
VIGLVLLVACSGDPPAPVCVNPGVEGAQATLDEAAEVWAPNPDAVPLAWRFRARGTEPLCATVTVDDGTGPRDLQTDGAVSPVSLPLLGLRADSTVEVSWTLTDTLDGVVDSGSTTLDTPPLPVRFPRFELLAHDPARQEPGHVLIDVKTPAYDVADDQEPISVAAYVMVLDQDLEVIWWFDPGAKVGDLALGPEGQLWGVVGGNVQRWSWFGETLDTWRSNADAESPVPVDARNFHHEVVPLADGSFWTLSYQVTPVDAYPRDYAEPDVLGPAAELDDALALRVLPDGTLADRWAMTDVLDTTRLGFDSLDRINQERYDWVHANALVADPADGGLIVSLRHQDAVVKLDSDGELLWILGTHAGWSEPFQDALLTPVGDVSWPYHQHAPSLADDGTLLVFDNGNWGFNPYEDPEAANPEESRVLAYRIDEVAGTVEQLWEYRDTLSGPLYSSALGGADPLPQTGNVLATYGFLNAESGVDNVDAGLGIKTIRLIQIDPDLPDDPVVDLRLYGLVEEEAEGWKSYRADPIGLLWDVAGE